MPPLTNTALSIHLSFPVLPQHFYPSPSQHSSLSVSLCGFGPEGHLFQTGSLINTLPWSLIEAVQVSAVRRVISALRVANDACDVWNIVSLRDDTTKSRINNFQTYGLLLRATVAGISLLLLISFTPAHHCSRSLHSVMTGRLKKIHFICQIRPETALRLNCEGMVNGLIRVVWAFSRP